MNTITIDIILDRSNAREVLRALLHSILFHRLFGTIKPQTFEVLDVTMPGVSDRRIEQLVDDKVAAFWKAIESGANRRGRITVTFSGKQQRKNWIGYTYDEEVPWEQWIIDAEMRQPKSEQERIKFNRNLSETLAKSLTTMLTHTASEKGRAAVPPITNQDVSPFPLAIAAIVGGVEVS